MKGHLLELNQALSEVRFTLYVSKSTGETYPGLAVGGSTPQSAALPLGQEQEARTNSQLPCPQGGGVEPQALCPAVLVCVTLYVAKSTGETYPG